MIPTKEQAQTLIEQIKAETATDIISIKVKPNADLQITQSNFGGDFYLPKTAQIPTNNKGEQLMFLAQINCEELPENNIYPKTGIMQFWIFGNGDYGIANSRILTSDNKKRVLYYPTIEEHYSKEELQTIYKPQCDEDGNLYSPIEKGNPFGLEFCIEKQGFNVSDSNFEGVFIEKWNEVFPNFEIEDISNLEEFEEDFGFNIFDIFEDEKVQHQIGGYAYFTQNDPREDYEKYQEYTELLLQINSDWNRKYCIMWGDAGVGNFFATKEQLKNLNFANALYNWDCS